MNVTGGTTDVTTYFMMRLAATGVAATALTIANLKLQYTRTGVAPTAMVAATALAATDTAHTDNYAIEIDATDQPGVYRIDWPDAAFAAGVRQAILSVVCATCFSETLAVNIDIPVDLRKILGTAVSTPATAGILDINVKNIANAVVNTATAQVGANVVTQANIDFGALQKTSLNAATPASVQGNVGGNVTGSVGSVVGHTPQTADHTAAIATVDTVVDAIKADTGLIKLLI